MARSELDYADRMLRLRALLASFLALVDDAERANTRARGRLARSNAILASCALS